MADRRSTARDLAQIAVFAALIAALGLPGQLHVAGLAVPITLQTLGVMLAGAILGARRSFLAVLVFEVLTLAGLPLLAGGRGGAGVFVGPSAGYLYGWLPGALVIGLLTQLWIPRCPRWLDPVWLRIAAVALGGIVVVYACGVAWLVVKGTALWPAIAGNGVYLLGDSLKVIVTALVTGQVARGYPGLIPVPRTAGVPARTRV